MKFEELQEAISTYMYTEDNGMSRIALASIVATRLKLGDPVWLIIIGPPSSGKSQILRPLALTDEKFIHRVDDLTENTFLSGTKVKEGQPGVSLLNRIGKQGIIVVSDFTVIFSKSVETRAAILSQFRMVYDGEMVKFSGNSPKPISWKGYLGIVAGSTPSIYAHFEEVADMGERFIYYRMKNFDVEKATRRSLSRTIYGNELDSTISNLYKDYIKECVQAVDGVSIPAISPETYDRIVHISMFAAKLRTPIHYDRYQRLVDKIPVSEMPMRVAQQLCALAKGLMVMHYKDHGNWDLGEEDIAYIEWCAYSLANEERRACLRVLASFDADSYIQTQIIADRIGLSTSIVGMNLQHLAAIGILRRSGGDSSLTWQIADEDVWKKIRKFEGIHVSHETEQRSLAIDEADGVEDGLENF